MYTKTPLFFPSPPFTIDDFDKVYRELILNTYEQRFVSVADARLYLAIQGVDLDTLIQILLAMEEAEEESLTKPVIDSLFSPCGCGDTANAFCKILTGNEMIPHRSKSPNTIEQLLSTLGDNFPKLIRLDIPGHSYVMLASELIAEEVYGYVYQSNIAQGMEDNSFSITAWIKDPKSCKTNLTVHLQKVQQLLAPQTPKNIQASLYRELYFAEPIVPVVEEAYLDIILDSISEDPCFFYTIKSVSALSMFYVLERFKKELCTNIDEQDLSLQEYIKAIKGKQKLSTST